MSDSVWPYGQQPTRLLCSQDSLGKNTEVGCHFLLHPLHKDKLIALWECPSTLFLTFTFLILIFFLYLWLCHFDYSMLCLIPLCMNPVWDSELPGIGWIFPSPGYLLSLQIYSQASSLSLSLSLSLFSFWNLYNASVSLFDIFPEVC